MAAYDISATQKAIVAYGTTIFSGGGSGPVDWAAITSKPSLYYTTTFTDSRNIAINHNMRKYPSVRVIDTALTEWHGAKVIYTDLNNIVVQFNYMFGGTIWLA
jgi:hypothetical protein